MNPTVKTHLIFPTENGTRKKNEEEFMICRTVIAIEGAFRTSKKLFFKTAEQWKYMLNILKWWRSEGISSSEMKGGNCKYVRTVFTVHSE